VVNAGPVDGQGSISVINAENNTVAATIPLHRQPVAIDLDAEASWLTSPTPVPTPSPLSI